MAVRSQKESLAGELVGLARGCQAIHQVEGCRIERVLRRIKWRENCPEDHHQRDNSRDDRDRRMPEGPHHIAFQMRWKREGSAGLREASLISMPLCRAAARPQARIEQEIEKVDNEIGDHEHGCHEHEIGRHHRHIGELHGIDEKRAKARPLETVSVTIAKAMTEPSWRPAMVTTGTSVLRSAWRNSMTRSPEATGAGEADEIGTHHLQHLGAHKAHDERELEEGECQNRHDQRFAARFGEQSCAPPADLHGFPAPERRKPAQFHGENVDEPDADEEGGQRHADQADRHDRIRQKSRRLIAT